MSLKSKIALFIFIVVFCSGWLIYLYQHFLVGEQNSDWRTQQSEQLDKMKADLMAKLNLESASLNQNFKVDERPQLIFKSYFKKSTVEQTKQAILDFLKQNDIEAIAKDLQIAGSLSVIDVELPLQERKELLEKIKKDPQVIDLQSAMGVWHLTLKSPLYQDEATAWLKNYPGVILKSDFEIIADAGSLPYAQSLASQIETLRSLYPEILQ